jgi:hypothetical protein
MSIGIHVHVDRQKMPDLAQWREAIVKRGYPLVLLDSFDVLSPPGSISCRYDGEVTEFEYYFNDNPELPPPPKFSASQRAIAEFRINTRFGDPGWFAAVAAADALCAATGGVIEDDDSSYHRGRSAASWAKGIIYADEVLAKKALAFPHPDTVAEEKPSRGEKSWWQFWKT